MFNDIYVLSKSLLFSLTRFQRLFCQQNTFVSIACTSNPEYEFKVMCEELISPISYSRIAKTNIDAPMENKKALINIRSARIKV